MGNFRCGTTNSDNGSRDLEDLASIPDLVGGATAEVLTEMSNKGCLARQGVMSPMPPASEKSARIFSWLSESGYPFKRTLMIISEGDKEGSFLTKYIDFSLSVTTPKLFLPFSPYNGPLIKI